MRLNSISEVLGHGVLFGRSAAHCLRLIHLIGRTFSPLMPDRDQRSDHRDARYRRKDGLKRA